MPLHQPLQGRQAGEDHQVPDGGHHQQRNHLQIAVVDDLHGIEQVRHGEDVDHRGALGQADQVVEGRGQDAAHRLGQDDAADLPAARQAQRRGGLALAVVDRQQPAADRLGRERGLAQREADRGRHEGRDEPGGGRIEQHMPGEGHGDMHRLVEIAEVVQQEQQHDQRDRAEQPDVAPGQRAQQGRGGQARQRHRQRQREAGRAAHQGQHQGLDEAVEHRRREEPLREHAPFPARIAEHRVEHQREQRERQHAAGDAPQAPVRHDAQVPVVVGPARLAEGTRAERESRDVPGAVVHGLDSFGLRRRRVRRPGGRAGSRGVAGRDGRARSARSARAGSARALPAPESRGARSRRSLRPAPGSRG